MFLVVRFAARLLKVLGLLVVAVAPPEPAAAETVFPSLTISAPGASGAAAVSALGSALPAVAAYYGKTAEQLRQELLRDGGLRVGRTGRLYHVSPLGRGSGGAAPAMAAFSMPWAPERPAPLAQTFQLHSNPGAAKTIYLNFTGQTLTAESHKTVAEAGYAAIVVPPFSNDTNAAFSDGELAIIQEIWQRVAEDYAPFDVDVTTEPVAQDRITRADASDPNYGIDVLFAAEAPEWKCLACAGWSYPKAFFDRADDTYKPAVVFHSMGSSFDPQALADAASREIGITLGLSFDGVSVDEGYYNGQGDSLVNGWAPIMGGLSSRPLRQFDKGEYANARSIDAYGAGSAPEDDFAVITGNGLPLRADEAGDTIATATWLPVGSSGGRGTASFDGVITSAEDADVFWLRAGTGLLEVNAAPAAVGANADLMLTLRDAAGNVVETSSPAEDLSASISRQILTPGRYYLEVRGTGEGDPLVTGYSSYGSVGAYALSGSFVTPPNSQPNAAFSASPATGRAPLTVTFNPSASGDDGQVVRYLWDFGDGTSRTEAAATPVQRTFGTQGDYTVTLRVVDDTGLSATASRLVKATSASAGAPPTASFTASTVSGTAPLQVTFDGSGSSDDGRITAYHWDFGDRTSQDSGSPGPVVKTFDTAGTYVVKLRVTDDDGDTGEASRSIIVTPAPQSPVASFTASTDSGTAPLKVTFDASGSSDDGRITAYRWDFGDRTSQDADSPGPVVKTFTAAGVYKVTLRVTDDGGLTNETSRSISVRDAPVANVPRVTDVSVIFARAARNRVKGRAAVSVVDASGRPAGGATVIARWSGPVDGSSSARTGRTGKVNLTSPSTAAPGCIRVTIVAVKLGSGTYPADPPVYGEACR